MKPLKQKQKEVVVVEKSCSESSLDLPKGHFTKANKIIEAINKANEKKNVAFSKMTMMEKRVALAQDVLASLKAEKYVAESGTYVQLCNTERNVGNTIQNLLKEGVQCNVCAIGSLFVSRVKMSKTKTMTNDSDKMVKSMRGIFNEKALRTLEYFFEGDDAASFFEEDEDGDADIASDAWDFYRSHTNDENRLIAIMENIIANKGRFIYKDVKI